MRAHLLKIFAGLVVLVAAAPSRAAGDFPAASCKGWGGTIVYKHGVNTAHAVMRGMTTPADLREYCERDPGGETIQYGGTETVDQCVAIDMPLASSQSLSAEANCGTGAVTFRIGQHAPARRSFRFGPMLMIPVVPACRR